MGILIIIFVSISSFIGVNSVFGEVLYSSNDLERIKGLKRIEKTVEMFKEKKGYYPFSNARRADLQFINVHISDQNLEGDDRYLPWGITGPQLGMQALIKEFKRQGLEDHAIFVYDKRPVNSDDPCQKYYIYNWQGGTRQCYSLSINLKKDVIQKGYKIADMCYPYVISNCKDSKPPYLFIRKKPNNN